MINLTPHDWTMLGAFGCAFVAMIIAGNYGLDRDENMKWRVSTEGNRVPAFFVVLLFVAAAALFIFGPKAA
jgi:uncharacterized membrane protein YdjX (TVP38/TMEM64 family)